MLLQNSQCCVRLCDILCVFDKHLVMSGAHRNEYGIMRTGYFCHTLELRGLLLFQPALELQAIVGDWNYEDSPQIQSQAHLTYVQ